ncbi:MAG: hypothetical protein HOV80_00040 [Polyangiaceae bacterium]|nr:hypothetical protein [Polyangiaceae bacterium]
MYSLTQALEVEASHVAVWKLLSDFESTPAWNTKVSSTRLVGDVRRGVGVSRESELEGAGVLREDVVEWDEGKWMRVHLSDSSLPLASAKLMLGVEPCGPGRSTVIVEMEYEPLEASKRCFGSRFALRGKLCRSVHRMLETFKSTAEATASTDGVLRPVRA